MKENDKLKTEATVKKKKKKSIKNQSIIKKEKMINLST